MTWREAFLQQARSDYAMFKMLNKTKQPICHSLHYLQMATEKLAKAFLCSPKDVPPPPTHSAALRFLKISKGRPEIRRKLGYDNYNAYNAYIDSLLDFTEKVEKLAPVGRHVGQINPEYPWQTPNGEIICPATYGYPEFQKTELVKFQALISNLFRIV